MKNQQDESTRMDAVRSYHLLDTAPEVRYDNLVKLASNICNAPIAFISLMDSDRQWFKSKMGLEIDEYPRDETFCKYTMLQEELLEVEDSSKDPRFQDHIFVTNDPGIRFYAGKTLIDHDGNALGTFCVLDYAPRVLTEEQRFAMETIAQEVIAQMELRRANILLESKLSEAVAEKLALTEELIKNKEQEINFLHESVLQSALVASFNLSGNITHINEHFLRLLNYGKQELIGANHTRLIASDELSTASDFWNEIAAGNFISGRMKRIKKGGDEIWLQLTYSPVRNRENKIESILLVGQDISSDVSAEKILRDSKELAEQLTRAKDEFLANMSHEIRTPMNAIIGFTDLLSSGDLNATQREYVDSISMAGGNLLSIINDILDLSKLSSGKLNFEAAPFSIEKTIHSTVQLYLPHANKKDLNLDLEIVNPLPPLIIGDSNRLTQVLSNLLNNALKFTKQGSVKLTVSGNQVADKFNIQFKVADSGIGMPKDQLERIFERFTQVNQYATREYGGTGLGLNIVKQIVELQGGNIQVTSQENVGSVFTVDLSFEIADSMMNEKFNTTKVAEFNKSDYQLLLCEDNELNRRLAKTVIEQFGFNLDIVENGRLGVEAVQKKQYDLIIMDLQMPEMDGYEATRNIRKQLNSTIPIMAMTAHSLVGEREKCMEVGMNDYIPKPFRQQELLEKITRLLKEGGSNGSFASDHEEALEGVCDLSYLKGLSGGNKDFERELMELFTTQTPLDLTDLTGAMETQNAVVIADIAHKIKSSAQIMGALDAVDALQRLEGAARSETSDSQLIELSNEVISRLQETLKNISVILDKNEW